MYYSESNKCILSFTCEITQKRNAQRNRPYSLVRIYFGWMSRTKKNRPVWLLYKGVSNFRNSKCDVAPGFQLSSAI